MRAQEQVTLFNNTTNGTSATVTLEGGLYAVAYKGTGSGTVDLYVVGPDGSTGLKVITQITATTGYATAYLGPGSYYAVIATFTANYLALNRVPFE
jgi:hypothetical protein